MRKAPITHSKVLLVLLVGLLRMGSSEASETAATGSAGGGQSGGGIYSLSGRVSQFDIGKSSGGVWLLEGNLEAIIATANTDGRPTLAIQMAGNQIIVSWPQGLAGFELQTSPDLTAQSWVTVPTEGQNSLMQPAESGPVFFRLAKP